VGKGPSFPSSAQPQTSQPVQLWLCHSTLFLAFQPAQPRPSPWDQPRRSYPLGRARERESSPGTPLQVLPRRHPQWELSPGTPLRVLWRPLSPCSGRAHLAHPCKPRGVPPGDVSGVSEAFSTFQTKKGSRGVSPVHSFGGRCRAPGTEYPSPAATTGASAVQLSTGLSPQQSTGFSPQQSTGLSPQQSTGLAPPQQSTGLSPQPSTGPSSPAVTSGPSFPQLSTGKFLPRHTTGSLHQPHITGGLSPAWDTGSALPGAVPGGLKGSQESPQLRRALVRGMQREPQAWAPPCTASCPDHTVTKSHCPSGHPLSDRGGVGGTAYGQRKGCAGAGCAGCVGYRVPARALPAVCAWSREEGCLKEGSAASEDLRGTAPLLDLLGLAGSSPWSEGEGSGCGGEGEGEGEGDGEGRESCSRPAVKRPRGAEGEGLED